ncbi:hypothetical protein QL285_094796 [Trifolium repens]|jgi:hypothetical protein|nr:hypothetical protein QL285_094796 [Trifolium repens]
MHIHLSFFFKNKFCSHSINGDFNLFIENSGLKKDSRDPWVEFINGEKNDWLLKLVVKVKPSMILAVNLEEVNPRSMSVVKSKSTSC